jgi:dTDP-4-amino-4,6-dideoxygalactose transaminase
MFANHGALVKHQHEMEGINSRLDGLQAALLSAKLAHVPAWTAARQAVAARYGERLAGVGDLLLPRVRTGAGHVYHLYVIQTAHRDGLKAFLAERGVETAVHYPRALPLLPAYEYLRNDAGAFPRAVTAQQRILSLPIYPEIGVSMTDHVAQSVSEFFKRT